MRASLSCLNLPCSRLKGILATSRAWNSSLGHFIIATQNYQQNITSQNYGEIIALVGPGMAREATSLLRHHVYNTTCSASQSAYEIASYLWFLSEASLYLQFSLMVPSWRLLQRKISRKNTRNLKNLLDSSSINNNHSRISRRQIFS